MSWPWNFPSPPQVAGVIRESWGDPNRRILAMQHCVAALPEIHSYAPVSLNAVTVLDDADALHRAYWVGKRDEEGVLRRDREVP
jgi:hypothetical protein